MAPFFARIVYNIAVVNDLLAHINRGTERIQSNLHNIDCAHHTVRKSLSA